MFVSSSRFWISSASALVAVAAGSLLIACSDTRNFCDPLDCTDLKVTAADSGKSFNLKVGQAVILSLPSTGPVIVTNTNPVVMAQVENPRSGDVPFEAKAPGQARLGVSYKSCVHATTPCSFEVTATVIAIPLTQVQLSDSDAGKTSRVRVGQLVLVTLVGTDDPNYYEINAQPAGVLGWMLPPTVFPHGTWQGVLRGLAPGHATVTLLAPTCLEGRSCVRSISFNLIVNP